jgi:hypothetical protein
MVQVPSSIFSVARPLSVVNLEVWFILYQVSSEEMMFQEMTL